MPVFDVVTGEEDGKYFAYINHFGAEFLAMSDESLEDAYKKLILILSERLYKIRQIV